MYLREKWIDLHQTNKNKLSSPFYTNRRIHFTSGKVHFCDICFRKSPFANNSKTERHFSDFLGTSIVLHAYYYMIAKIGVIAEIFQLEGAEVFDGGLFISSLNLGCKSRTNRHTDRRRDVTPAIKLSRIIKVCS